MNAPIRIAQAGTQQSAAKETVITLTKPAAGQAITVKTGFDGKVKLDFSAIADERITIVRIGETAVIFFHDNKSTITLDPFFGSGNLPLANLEFDLGGNRIFTAEQIAGILPFTIYQGILPAAGEGAGGDPQDAGANFDPAIVEALNPPPLNELLPPEALGPIDFQAEISAALVDLIPTQSGLTVGGFVEEEHLRFQQPGSPFQLSDGNEDGIGQPGEDGDTPGDLNVTTITFTGNAGNGQSLQQLVLGGDPPITFTVNAVTGQPVKDTSGADMYSQGKQIFYHVVDANHVIGYTDEDGSSSFNGAVNDDGSYGFGDDRIVFWLEVQPNGDWTIEIYDQFDHASLDGLPGDDSENLISINFTPVIHATDGNGTGLDFTGNAFAPTVIDDVPIALHCNLLENGSFELGHNLAGSDWDIFATIPGWTWGPDNVPFEIQTGGAGGLGAQNGNALIELDGDTFGNPSHLPPQGTPDPNDTNATIQQSVVTQAGQFYELSFWYSPRPGSEGDGDSSSMEVLWNGSIVHTIDSTGMAPGWQQITVFVEGTGGLDTLGFRATGEENEFGALIDNVSLCATWIVDEDDIATPWSLGTSPFDGNADGSETEFNGLFAPAPAYVEGSLAGMVKIGADEYPTGWEGPLFSFSENAIDHMLSLGLFSKQTALPENGLPLYYEITAGPGINEVTLTAYEPDTPGPGNTGNPVFALTLNQLTGNFEFRLYDEIIHMPPPPGGSEENFDMRSGVPDPVQQSVPYLSFGDIIEFTDYDGDSVTLGHNFKIYIRDDVPEADLDIKHGDDLTHDETPNDTQGPDDVDFFDLPLLVRNAFSAVLNPGFDPHVPLDNGAIGYARDTDLIEIDFGLNDTEVGADSPALVTAVSLQIVGGDGTNSGLFTTEGDPILLYLENGLVVGRVGSQAGAAAFALHIEDDGDISLVQWLSLRHDDINDHDESDDNGFGSGDDGPVNENPNPEQQTLDGKINAILTVTDSDGDTATDTISIGDKIVFEDDGPKIELKAAHHKAVIHDETPSVQSADDDVPGSPALAALFSGVSTKGFDPDVPQDNGAIGYAQSDGPLVVIDEISYGSDGPQGGQQNVVYSLVLDSSEEDSGLKTTEGKSIHLFNQGGIIVGRYEDDGGDNPESDDPAAFAIHIDPATGQITVVQWVSIRHDDVNDHDESNDNGFGSGDDGPVNESPNPVQQWIKSGALYVEAKITDGDGDFDTDYVDIGHQVIFEDDGPKVTCTNLVSNGSFEEGHNLLGTQWEIFTNLGAWEMGADGVPFEVQLSGAAGPGINAQDGNAFIELDSDLVGNPAINPPGDINPTSITNATIQQTIATEAGQTFELTFWYMPRPNDGDADSSSMEVLWNGAVVHTIDSSSAPAGWQQITLQLTATGANSTIGFHGLGQQNQLGAYIDNVQLCQKGIVVDEDDLPGTGNSDVQDGDDLADPSPVSVNGTLSFETGADGLGSLNFASMHGDPVQTAGGANVTAGGAALSYVWSGNTLWATTNPGGPNDGNSAFKVVITNPLTGAYTFTLLNAVDHPLQDDSGDAPDKIAYEDNLDINLVWTVVDGDGDFANGVLKVNIDDDIPLVASDNTDYITNGDFIANSAPVASGFWGAAYAPGAMPGWTIAGDPTDPPSNIYFEKQADGFLGLSSSTNNGMIDTGASGGNYRLTQTVGAGAAADLVVGKQYVIEFEVAAPFPGTALLEVWYAGNLIGTIDTTKSSGEMDKYAFIVTATSADGDQLQLREVGTGDAPLGTEPGNPQNNLQDETYHGTYVTNFKMYALDAVADEDGLTLASGDYSQGNHDSQTGDAVDDNADGDNDESTTSGTLGIQWGADQYDTADAGVQDGAGGAPGLTGRHVTFTDTDIEVFGTNELRSHGDLVTLQLDLDGTVLRGIANDGTGDRVVFEVTLFDDGTGSFKFQLFDQLDHADGADENDIALKFNFTATDSDGDQAQGTFLVGVDDDVPVLTGEVCPAVGGDEPQPGKIANFVFVLDSSQSVEDQFALLQDAANNLLDSIGASGAEQVRVHIVQFNTGASVVGTYDLITGGVLDNGALTQAKTDISALTDGGFTNYEAGLQEALLWIQGGTKTIAVTDLISSFDANSNDSPPDFTNNDTARIVGNGSTHIALISGWQNTVTNPLLDANGSIAGGWGPGTDDQIDTGQLLRVDFGSFHDFDGAGVYNNAGGFNGTGVSVEFATFTLTDDPDNAPASTNFNWTIHYTDASTENGSLLVADSADITLGTTGKLINYIEFTVDDTHRGDVDLQSVATTVLPGTIPGAHVNELIFISDGEPNRAVDDNGNIITVGVQDAIEQITGVDDTSDELGETETDGDGAGQDQAFHINAYGISLPNVTPIDSATLYDASIGGNTDDGYVLYSNGTAISLVSGWISNGTVLDDVNGDGGGSGISNGWGVEGGGVGTDDGELDTTTERLRFDFGAFNDYDNGGEYGLQGAATGFSGPAITSATFVFRGWDGGDPQTVNWTIHFADLSPSEPGSANFNGSTSGTVAIAGTGGNLGKEIAYIEFTVPAGEGGAVDLQSVVLAGDPLGLGVLDQIDSDGDALNVTAPGDISTDLNTILLSLAGGGGGGGDVVNFDLGPIVDPGADEDVTFNWKTDTTPLETQGLKSNGTPLQYSFDGDTLIAHTGNPLNPVFTVLLNDSGKGTFTLIGDLDDTDGDVDGQLHVDFSAMVHAVDYDNDPVVLGPQVGPEWFCFEIEVGEPPARPELTLDGFVIHDESALLQTLDDGDQSDADEDDDDHDVVGSEIAYAASTVASLFAGIVDGQTASEPHIDADILDDTDAAQVAIGYARYKFVFVTNPAAPDVTRTFSLDIPAGPNVNSGLQTTAGESIFLFKEGGLIVGRISASPVNEDPAGLIAFAVAINPDGGDLVGGGEVFVAQYTSLLHGNDLNHDEQAAMIAASIQAVVTDTNAGGSVSDSIDIGANIIFEDDGPSLRRVAEKNNVVTLDESDFALDPSGPDDDTVSASLVAGETPIGENSNAFYENAVINYGADGPGTAVFSITGEDGASIDGLATGLFITGNPAEIVLVLNGSVVEGRAGGAGGQVAFAMAVDSVGVVLVQQFAPIFHTDNSDLEPSNDNEHDYFENLSALDLFVKLTVTDADGDTAEASQLPLRVRFEDDGPTVTGNTQSAEVYENEINGIGSGPALPDTDLNGDVAVNDENYTGNLTNLFSAGADGLGEYIVSATGLSASLTGLSSGGVLLTYEKHPTDNILIAKAGAVPVFEFILDPDTGQYQFKLLKALDHAEVDDLGTVGVNEDDELILDFSSAISVTDGDGDSIALPAGTLTITVNDDEIDAQDSAPTIVVGNEPTVVIPLVLDDEGTNALGITDNDALGDVDVPEAATTATGTLNITPGADGLKSVAFTDGGGVPSIVARNALGAVVALKAIYVDGDDVGHLRDITLTWNADLDENSNPLPGGGTLVGTAVDIGTVFTIEVDADGNYEFKTFAPLGHDLEDSPDTGDTEIEYEDNLTLEVAYKAADGDDDFDTAVLTLTVNDDTPDAGTPAELSVENGDSPLAFGALNASSGADGWSTPSFDFDTLPEGLTSGGEPIEYLQLGNTLVGYINGDHTVPANVVFAVALDLQSNTWSFDLNGSLDGAAAQILNIGGSTAFGSGPTSSHLLTTGSDGTGQQLAFLTGWDATGLDVTAWQSSVSPVVLPQAEINGSTAGWGVAPGNTFDGADFLRFDFDDNDFTATPFDGLSINSFEFEFSNFGGGDHTVKYVVHYTDGTTIDAGDIDFNGGSFVWNFVGDVGKFIDYVELYANGEGGGPKVDLTKVGVLTEGNDLNLSFNVNLNDGDGDAEQVALAVTVTPAVGPVAPVINEDASDLFGAVKESGDLPLIDEAGLGGGLQANFALSVDSQNGLASLASDTTQANFDTVFADVLADAGGNVGAAIAAIWAHLDPLYPGAVPPAPLDHPINVAFVRLGVEYADHVKNGGMPLIDVNAKFTPDDGDAGDDPERLQSLHDNLLGNLGAGPLAGRFDALEAELTGLVTAVDPDLPSRPFFSGNEGADPTAARLWDIANGFVTSATGTVIAADINGGPLTFSGNATGTYGTFSIDPNTGAWTYILDNYAAITQALAEGELQNEVFQVTVTDPTLLFDTVNVTIDITGTLDVEPNAAPVANHDTIYTNVLDGSNIVIPIASLLLNDTDANMDSLTIVGVGGVTGDILNATVVGSSVIVQVNPPTFTGGTLEYTVSDGQANSNVATVTINAVDSQQVNASGSIVIGDDQDIFLSILEDNRDAAVGDMDNEEVYKWDGTTLALEYGGANLTDTNENINALYTFPSRNFNFSTTGGGSLPMGVGFFAHANEDIVEYTAFVPQNTAYALGFDGSAVGLTNENIDAYHLLPNGEFLFSLDSSFTSGSTAFQDEDIILWDGANFRMFFDGSEHGITGNIDALSLLATGDIVFSLSDDVNNLAGVNANDFEDWDLVRWNGKEFSLFFDGSILDDTDSGDDDLNAASVRGSDILIGSDADDYIVGNGGDDLLLGADGGLRVVRADVRSGDTGSVNNQFGFIFAAAAVAADYIQSIQIVLPAGGGVFDPVGRPFAVGSESTVALADIASTSVTDGGRVLTITFDPGTFTLGDMLRFVIDTDDSGGVDMDGGSDLGQEDVQFNVTYCDGQTITGVYEEGPNSNSIGEIRSIAFEPGTDGDDVLLGGNGIDYLAGGAGNDTLTGGAQGDAFFFNHTGAAHVDEVTDYVFGEGDKLDLSALLDGVFDAGDTIGDFVQVLDTGADALVQVDLNGSAGGENWEDVAVLTGYGDTSNFVRVVLDNMEQQVQVT